MRWASANPPGCQGCREARGKARGDASYRSNAKREFQPRQPGSQPRRPFPSEGATPSTPKVKRRKSYQLNTLAQAPYFSRSRQLSLSDSGAKKGAPSTRTSLVDRSSKAGLAEWRKRVHAARRRTLIVIRTALLFRRGHRHPARLQPFDDMSFFIPELLGADKERFVKEYHRYLGLNQKVNELNAALSAAMDAEGSGGIHRTSSLITAYTADANSLQMLKEEGLGGYPMTEPLSKIEVNSLLKRGSGSGVGLADLLQRRSSLSGSTAMPPPGRPGARSSWMHERNRLLTKQASLNGTELGRRSSGGEGSGMEESGVPNGSRGLEGRQSLPAVQEQLASPQGSSIRGKPSSPDQMPNFESLGGGSGGGGNDPMPAPGPRQSPLRRGFQSGASLSKTDYGGRLLDRATSARLSLKPSASSSSQRNVFAGAGAASGGSRFSKLMGAQQEREQLLEQLQEQLKAELVTLQASSNLLTMFLNRCNSAWADAHQWAAPVTLGEHSNHDKDEFYKAETIRKLREGKIAVQLLAGSDYIQMPGGHSEPIWGIDPWDLVEQQRPGMLPAGTRIVGLALGARVLCGLVGQVVEVAGADALGRLCLVMHITEQQEELVIKELWGRQFYGLHRENVIFVPHERHPGFTYDSKEGVFVRALGEDGMYDQGTGYLMGQWVWPGHGFTLSDQCVREPLSLPVLEVLQQREVEWIISRRCRDLAMLGRSGVIDLLGLAQCTHLKEAIVTDGYMLGGRPKPITSYRTVGIVVDVAMVENAAALRQYGSIVLQCTSSSGAVGSLQKPMVELLQCELTTPQLMLKVEEVRNECNGRLAVGLGRYLLHVPTLRGLLSSSAAFRPKLNLEGDSIHMQLDMADLTAGPAMSVAVESRNPPNLLVSVDNLEAMVPAVMAQDSDPRFRSILAERVLGREHGVLVISGSNQTGEDSKVAIIVFLCTNPLAPKAVNTALYIARPGQDVVHLVHVVNLEVNRAAGKEFLQEFYEQALKCMVEVRGSLGLLDSMQNYVVQQCRQQQEVMLVMGSMSLTSPAADALTLSVTMNFLRRLVGLPVVLLTQNSKYSPAPTTRGARIMVVVEPIAHKLLKMVCTRILASRQQGDKLLLAQVLSSTSYTRQQHTNHRRVLDNFQSLAIGYRSPSARSMTLHGPMDEVLCPATELHIVGILAVQLPSGTLTKTPELKLLNLLRGCKGAILLYQEPVAGDRTLLYKSELFM